MQDSGQGVSMVVMDEMLDVFQKHHLGVFGLYYSEHRINERTSCVFESSHLSRNAERLARESCTQHVMYGYEILRNRSYVPEREFPVVRLIYFLGVRVEFG